MLDISVTEPRFRCIAVSAKALIRADRQPRQPNHPRRKGLLHPPLQFLLVSRLYLCRLLRLLRLTDTVDRATSIVL